MNLSARTVDLGDRRIKLMGEGLLSSKTPRGLSVNQRLSRTVCKPRE